jgi:hypothetical protein
MINLVHTAKSDCPASVKRLTSIIHDRKSLGIDGTDLALLMYLVLTSSSRLYIRKTTEELSTILGVHLKAVYRSIAKLRKLDYIRKVKYNGASGIMVSPDLADTASIQRRSFKYKLWIEAGEQSKE